MYTLFIDTHDKLITISFCNENKIIVDTVESESHSTHFLPLLKNMMDKSKIEFKDIKNLVVVNGPGSFTGVRIGLTIGKTISYSLNIPIYLISSLKAYLVSNQKNDDDIAVIEDSKGFYVGSSNEEVYIKSLKNYNDRNIVNNELNIEKIINFVMKGKPVNVHTVKANYVKVIEVLK